MERENRDYIPEEKSNLFMNPKDVARVILDNAINYNSLNVSDITIIIKVIVLMEIIICIEKK